MSSPSAYASAGSSPVDRPSACRRGGGASQIDALERLKVKRREYIDKGCDKIEWLNRKHATEAERRTMRAPLRISKKQIADQKDVLGRL